MWFKVFRSRSPPKNWGGTTRGSSDVQIPKKGRGEKGVLNFWDGLSSKGSV